MRNFFLWICFLLFSYSAAAQKENNIWFGGDYVGIDFNSGSPVLFDRTDNNNIWRTNASICDKNGNLLFYTNGYRIFNKNFQIMQNGNNLDIGDYVNFGYNELAVEDGAVIVPVPGDSNKFYLFHTDLNYSFDTFPQMLIPMHLMYSIVDMTLDNGLGAVVSDKKDVIILSDTLTHNGMQVVKHANGRDYWIIMHEASTNRYWRFLIDPYGIHGPYSQCIGSILDGINALGYAPLTFNQEGFKAVQVAELFDYAELYDFNRCSGEFCNQKIFKLNDTIFHVGDVEFSPNGRYLYVTADFFNFLYQYDIISENIYNSRKLVATYDGTLNPFKTDFYLLCRAPDEKIYCCSFGGNKSIHVINYPDSAGVSCGFVENAFSVNPPGTNWGGTFPNVVNYSLPALKGSECDTLTIYPQPNFTFGVYPNPFSNELQLTITGATTESTIEIINLLGQIIYSDKINPKDYFIHASINLSLLSAGIYFVKTEVNGSEFARKVVKN